jgi:competence protein ComEC
MALANPAVIRDVGFQLSFAATLGLVTFSEPLANGFAQAASRYLRISTVRRITPIIADAALLTLAAQLATLPVTLYHFGRISLSSLLVNPLILPVQPALMILGGISLIAGLAWQPLGKLLALPVYPLAAYTIRLVEGSASLPGGVWSPGPAGSALAIGLFIAIFALPPLFRLAARAQRAAIAWKAFILLALVLAAAIAWRRALAVPDGMLQLTFLEAGPGDGILIRGPHGRYVLVDGGPSASLLSEQLGRRLPPGERSLDWLVVASPGDDQLGALPRLLDRFPPQSVLWSGSKNASRSARQLQEALTDSGIPIRDAESGQVLDLGNGAYLSVIWAGRGGLVLRLAWGRFSALLPVGQDQETLALAYEPVSLLMLAGQGYAALNPPDWLAALQPQAVIVSVEAGNHEGLPSPSTLEALAGYTILRTDRLGWIEFRTDGERLWVGAEKR